MRVLFATTAGSGHFGPLIPFAGACSKAGHQVKVAAPASFAAAVRGAGFDHAPFANPPDDVISAVFARLPELSFEEANETVVAEVFGRLDARAALPGVTELISVWHPDVVVREPCEFASLVAAERAGVPQVQVAIGMGNLAVLALPMLAGPLAELGVLAGLTEEQASTTLLSTSGFTSVPAVLEGVDTSASRAKTMPKATGGLWRFRDPSLLHVAGSLPSPWGDPDWPLVYVTFGTVTAGLGSFSALYSEVLDALADLPIRVLMTTGGDHEPVGPWPLNAHVERWWPQADVMAHADVVVGHGGFGTTMTALATGVPQIVVPLFAFDQVINAERVAAAGAGVHVPHGPGAVAEIAATVARVLTDADYRRAARNVAAEIADLPDVAASVAVLEELAGRSFRDLGPVTVGDGTGHARREQPRGVDDVVSDEDVDGP